MKTTISETSLVWGLFLMLDFDEIVRWFETVDTLKNEMIFFCATNCMQSLQQLMRSARNGRNEKLIKIPNLLSSIE